MAQGKNHLSQHPIPPGYQIYERMIEVAGIHHHKAAATRFVRGRGLSLALEREPSNRHDPNAIKVLGCSTGLMGAQRQHIGYVPKEIAAAIVTGNYSDHVQARLDRTYLGDRGFVAVRFQLLGPKGHMDGYDGLRQRDDVDDDDDGFEGYYDDEGPPVGRVVGVLDISSGQVRKGTPQRRASTTKTGGCGRTLTIVLAALFGLYLIGAVCGRGSAGARDVPLPRQTIEQPGADAH
jgi:hypothetical protein